MQWTYKPRYALDEIKKTTNCPVLFSRSKPYGNIPEGSAMRHERARLFVKGGAPFDKKAQEQGLPGSDTPSGGSECHYEIGDTKVTVPRCVAPPMLLDACDSREFAVRM